MSRYVPVALRRLVADRAERVCEYCLIHEDDTFLGCEIEHVVSEKHGGAAMEENLAYACVFCNRFKGTDLGSVVPATGQLVRFFNPRTDRWSDHFQLNGGQIVALTEIGQVTARVLEINHPDRLLEREQLRVVGRYPCPEAISRIVAI